MPTPRLSLKYLSDQITIRNTAIDTAVAAEKIRAIGNGTLSGSDATLYAVLDYFKTTMDSFSGSNATFATDLQTIQNGLNSSNAYNSIYDLANRVSAIQTQLDQTNANSSFDTLKEISDYLVTHAEACNLDSVKVNKTAVMSGSGSFNHDGTGTYTQITFATPLEANTSYTVLITPDIPDGIATTGIIATIGNIYVDNLLNTGFKVYCTGDSTENFTYLVLLDNEL